MHICPRKRFRHFSFPAGTLLFLLSAVAPHASGQGAATERVEIASDGWRIIGERVVPKARGPVPAVLMFNAAARDRTPYRELAGHLARIGIASLRVDLRGHGESINLGKFVPSEGTALIADSDHDVAAVFAFLKADKRIDRNRIGFVGASYSGEMMMIAGKKAGYGAAYVALSPGSLSDESIGAIDQHKLPWLLVVARHERHLKEVAQALREQSRTAEFLELNSAEHGTRLFGAHPDLAERLAVWFRYRLVGNRRLVSSSMLINIPVIPNLVRRTR